MKMKTSKEMMKRGLTTVAFIQMKLLSLRLFEFCCCCRCKYFDNFLALSVCYCFISAVLCLWCCCFCLLWCCGLAFEAIELVFLLLRCYWYGYVPIALCSWYFVASMDDYTMISGYLVCFINLSILWLKVRALNTGLNSMMEWNGRVPPTIKDKYPRN